jgi:transforming growth factor-beta-induced protein
MRKEDHQENTITFRNFNLNVKPLYLYIIFRRKKMKLVTRIIMVLLVLAVALSTFSPALASYKKDTIMSKVSEINAATGEFSTLKAALEATKLDKFLDASYRQFNDKTNRKLGYRAEYRRQFTVFAPTDAAFAKLGLNASNVATALDKQTLYDILLYHVAYGEYKADRLAQRSQLRMLNYQKAFITSIGSTLLINNSRVVQADVDVSNGVIHVIDSVLLPPKDIVDTAVADGRFTTLVAAVQAAGLVDTLKGPGPFTVFAPTDDAFARLPAGTVESLLLPENLVALQNILLYHVAPGKVTSDVVVTLSTAETAAGIPVRIQVIDGKVYINDAQVIITDIIASNGVIHVIDSVLLPPKDIVDTAVADGRFTTLVAAVQAAGLVDTLKGPGPFTVFAPTDDAFARLPAGTVESLLLPENQAALQNILLYHVAEGFIFADEAVRSRSGCRAGGHPQRPRSLHRLCPH